MTGAVGDSDGDGHQPWERQPGERARQYAGFRIFRDLPAAERSVDPVADELGASARQARDWAKRWDWHARADAWDDECHRIEDRERLEAIRVMHSNHRRAGRVAMHKALEALGALPADRIPAGAAARLLELGARLERQTLTVSVEDLQGLVGEDGEVDDPWERIARELDPDAAS